MMHYLGLCVDICTHTCGKSHRSQSCCSVQASSQHQHPLRVIKHSFLVLSVMPPKSLAFFFATRGSPIAHPCCPPTVPTLHRRNPTLAHPTTRPPGERDEACHLLAQGEGEMTCASCTAVRSDHHYFNVPVRRGLLTVQEHTHTHTHDHSAAWRVVETAKSD